MQDLEDHPFSPQNVARESGAPDESERKWSSWTKSVKALLEIESLDGDQRADGYSLDFAHDEFMNGLTPEEYAAEVRAARAAVGPKAP